MIWGNWRKTFVSLRGKLFLRHSEYHNLVSEYEIVSDSMTNKKLPTGGNTLKDIGDRLRVVIQYMETKVIAYHFRATKFLFFGIF
jgi:hypothetical protein